MKKLSLQWRITLMTALLIGATCIFMNVLIGYSGSHYMDSIGSYVTGYGDTDNGEPDFFDPEHEKLDRELTIVINGAQESFIATNWYITAAATLLGGVLAYFQIFFYFFSSGSTIFNRIATTAAGTIPDPPKISWIACGVWAKIAVLAPIP